MHSTSTETDHQGKAINCLCSTYKFISIGIYPSPCLLVGKDRQYSSSSYVLDCIHSTSSTNLALLTTPLLHFIWDLVPVYGSLTRKQPRQPPSFLSQCSLHSSAVSHSSCTLHHCNGWRCSSSYKITNHHLLDSTNGMFHS